MEEETIYPITIDPIISWKSFYGGTGIDYGRSVATDNLGNVYMSGYTSSTNAIAAGGQQNSFGGGTYDGFLAKFDGLGNRIWATYYGGTQNDYFFSSAVDASGNVLVAGETSSTGISFSGHQNLFGGGLNDGLIIKFNAAGARLWASYYGGIGDDKILSLDVDAGGSFYIAGETTSTTSISASGFQNPFGGGTDGFLIKFNTAGVRQWGTYYGGNGFDHATGLAIDPSNAVYITGFTNSSFAIASGGVQNTFGGLYDAYLVKFSETGSRHWGTYYGGSEPEYGVDVATDKQGNVYLTGERTLNAWGPAPAFLIKYDSSGGQLWFLYQVGIFHRIFSIAVSPYDNSVIACGNTTNWNDKRSYINSLSENGTIAANNGITTQYPPDDPVSSSVAVDRFGNVFFTGWTIKSLTNFYLQNVDVGLINRTGHQNNHGGATDAFLIQYNHAETDLSKSLGSGFSFSGNQFLDLTKDAFGNYFTYGSNSNGTTSIRKYSPSNTLLWTVTNSFGLDHFVTDQNGNLIIVGRALYGANGIPPGIPLNAHQSTFGGGFYDAYLIKYNANGTKLWGTLYGGAGDENYLSVSVDGSGNIFISGGTNSTTGIASGGHQNTNGGGSDAFLVKFNPNGVRLWGTYYGGNSNSELAFCSTADSNGNIYLGGRTSSTTGIAISGHQNTLAGQTDGFLVKFNSNGVRQWGSYYGGTGGESIYDLAIDGSGNLYAAINTNSTNGISFNGHQNTYGGGAYDNALVKFNSSGTRLWATYYGGSGHEELSTRSLALDIQNNVYLAGNTTSSSGIAQKGLLNQYQSPHFLDFFVKFSPTGNREIASYLYIANGDSGSNGTLRLGILIDELSQVHVFSDTYRWKLPHLMAPAVTEPTNQASAFSASNITVSSMKVSFSAAAGAPHGYMVLRRAGAAPAGVPADGVTYNLGQSLGNGTVAYIGNSLSFNNINLLAGTTYHFAIYAFNGTGPNVNYRTVSPLFGNATTAASTPQPLNQPTNFYTSNITPYSMSVGFSAASDYPTGYIAIMKPYDYPLQAPVDGLSYSYGQNLGDGIVVHSDGTTIFYPNGLLESTWYYFAIYSYNYGVTGYNYLEAYPLLGYGITDGGGFCCEMLQAESGVEETTIVPNPVSDVLKVQFPQDVKIYSLDLLDVTGRRVLSVGNKKNDTIEMDVNGLTDGLYLMKVQTNKGVEVHQVVVKH
jgi:hypothetical protein